MVGATDNEDGYKGLVATPKPSDKNKFWRGDGTWAEAGGGGGSDLPLSVVNGKLCITYEDS
jgi:hypothetical protein